MKKIVLSLLFLAVAIPLFIYSNNSLKLFNSNQSINSQEKVSQNTKKINDETDRYKIDISYPEFSPLNPQTQSINKSVYEQINLVLNDFKDGLSKSTPPPELKDVKSELSIKYDVIRMDNSVISIRFISSEYLVGQAHPLSIYLVTNYSLKQNRPLNISDLFKKDSGYLQTLSDISSKKLRDNFAENNENFDDFIKSGTSPEQKNFEKFNLTSDNLELLFDPYQVAPYVAGPQTVKIPFPQINEILSQDIKSLL